MELSQTVSALQEEMKLLKSEIKTVLKDIRAAVLNNDNPFSLDPTAAAPISNVSVPREEPPVEQEEELETATESEPSPLPGEQPPPPPTRPPGGPMGSEPTPLHPNEHEEPARPPELRWNLLTIAGLMTWAEEAVATLGRQRFQIILELACVAELISSDVRDVLVRIAQLAPAKDVQNQPMSVIEGLVVLHELEAILQGEKITRLTRRGRGRRPGALVWSSA